jgi:hypothetical protein
MVAYILKVLTVILWSTFKYIIGFITSLGLGFGFVETLIYNVGGGMLGVIVYLYLWGFLVKLKQRFFPSKPKQGIKMSKSRRWLVKFIQKYEIYGIVILTPILLSVPVGTILAAALEDNKWKIKRFMLFSFIGWTLALYAIYALFGIRLDEVIDRLF